MPKSKFFELLAKFAAEPTAMQPGDVVAPSVQSKDETGYDLQMKFRLVLSEMGHELGLLKERDFDPKMYKMFSATRQHLASIYGNLDPNNPLPAARDLVHYLNNRHNKAILGNLEFLSKHHLKQTNVEMQETKLLVHPQIRSFALLPKLQELAQKIVETEPAAARSETMKATPTSRSQQVPVIPGPPKLPTFKTPLPATSPESPEAKKKQDEEVG